jgi:hypothetical protein
MPQHSPRVTEPAWYDETYDEEARLRESGVQQVARSTNQPIHEALYSEIVTSWFSPANDDEAQEEPVFDVRALHHVPVIASRSRANAASEVDHRVAFILGLVDGFTAIGDIVELASLPSSQVLTTISDLLDDGVIAVR